MLFAAVHESLAQGRRYRSVAESLLLWKERTSNIRRFGSEQKLADNCAVCSNFRCWRSDGEQDFGHLIGDSIPKAILQAHRRAIECILPGL
jgi:hypothetical protein